MADSDLSASEKRMLLRMRGRSKEERSQARRIKKERDKERREHERTVLRSLVFRLSNLFCSVQVTRERHDRHRADGLVVEHLVPARLGDRDRADLMTFKEMRERLLNKDKIREEQMREVRSDD